MPEGQNDKKILIVEDDMFLSELVSVRFQKEGLHFSVKTDGETALEEARNVHPNLIILDILLPGIDGYEVLKRLKEDKELSNIPVLIISNLGRKDEIDKARDLGAVGFLVKARADLDDIVAKVRGLLK